MSAPLLPPDVAQGLHSAVKRAASDALRCKAAPRGTDEQTHRRLKRELRACVEEALSDMSSAFNAEKTLPGRVSNELWCIVWSFLPMAALVRATHVCRRWRNVALGCSQLWCWIEYESDIHYDDCDCHLDPGFFGTPRCEDGPGSSNLGAVKMFLSRSGNTLPISLGMTVFGEYSSRDELQRFATALEPYVDRLAMIRCTAYRDQEIFALFLEHFDWFPMLRVLQGSSNYLSHTPRKCAGFLYRPLRLPALRKLRLIGSLDSRGIMPDTLPVLDNLFVGGSRMEPQDVLEYLKVAPALHQLRIQAPSAQPRAQPRAQSADILAQARDLATGRCMSVDISNLSAGGDAPFLTVFGDGGRHRRIGLAYTEGQGNLTVDGARIFGHLERVEELAVYYRLNAQLVVAARAPDGRERALEFRKRPGHDARDMQIDTVWTHLRAPPDALRVDSRVWAALRVPEQVRGHVKKLDLVFDSSAADPDDLGSPGAFSLLDELTLSGEVLASPGNFPRVAAAAVLRFLQAVAVPGVVKSLVLNRVEVTGDRAGLESAVQNVIVQSG